MGTGSALDCAFALHDSNGRPFSVEFSLAAVFSFGSRDLRCGSAADVAGDGIKSATAGVSDPG